MARPRKELNSEEVFKLAKLACTHEEIADYFGVSKDTVERRLADDPDFAASYKRGLAEAKMSLRRKQLSVANTGNATLLIWLGKQMLNQKDRMEQEIGNLGGEPFKSTSTDLSALSTTDLQALLTIAQKASNDTSELTEYTEPGSD